MTAAFSRILSELLQDALVQADSAAIENMRCLSLPTGCAPQDLTDFLVSAAEIRLARARQQGIAPAAFYAWYDEMAGQLRFSTVPGRGDVLPFGPSVDRVPAPSHIVREALSTWCPGTIAMNELIEADWKDPDSQPLTIRVWVRTTEDVQQADE